MAYFKVLMENDMGNVKEAPVGFSWTMLFLNFFVPLKRGDFKWTLLTIVTTPVFSFIWAPFVYNKIYLKDLIHKGYKARNLSDVQFKNLKYKLGFEIPVA